VLDKTNNQAYLEPVKKLLCLFLLFSALQTVNAQVDLLFCTSIEDLETCKETEATFPWLGKETQLKLMVIDKDGLKTDRIKYKLYFIKSQGVEEMFAELFLTTKPDWLFASKTVFFMQPGNFKVMVYNNNNELLNTSYIKIAP